MCSDFMMRNSDMAMQMCKMCAEMCTACATMCEAMAKDNTMIDRANFQNPVASVASGTFGRITAANDPRVLQFALKLFF